MALNNKSKEPWDIKSQALLQVPLPCVWKCLQKELQLTRPLQKAHWT